MATISSLQVSLLPLFCLLLAVAAAADHQPQEQSTPASPPITLPGCPDRCGNVSIPYPFGIKDGCFLPGFFVVCNHTFDPPRPFINSSLTIGTIDDDPGSHIIVEDLYYLTSKNGTTTEETEPRLSVWPIELVGVSISDAKARLMGGFSYECILNETHHSVRRQRINFGFSINKVSSSYDTLSRTFFLSADDNMLLGIGSGVVAELTTEHSGTSNIPHTDDGSIVDGSCSAGDYCTANLTFDSYSSEVTVPKRAMYEASGHGQSYRVGDVNCFYAMIVEETWYSFLSVDLDSDEFLRRNAEGVVPIIADFRIGFECPKAGEPTPCISDNSMCVIDYCNCSVGYQGNPYIHGGCQDIDECAQPDKYPCHGKCKNIPGDYECSCPAGTRGNAKERPCTDLFSLPAKIAVGIVGGLLIIALLVFTILIRNEKRKMTEFFNKNGGPTLEKAKIIKIYKKGELNPILKPSNFIGRGAFGEVYKGFLDNQLVAVKKPIGDNVDVAQNDQFANEVIIQSQVIHKNIVRLIGCCLEVDQPMLVYEFLSKGSLDDILHASSCAPITLECRLNIAAESEEGLAYLHSKTTNIILHGDVKPANILLNDSFTPKISDFGISRLIARDKEHTDLVIGDRTYMDPVYLRDGLLTDKSDVYSFGVVLLELISRKKATYSDNNSLVRNFLDAHKSRKEATELFDKEIAKPEALKLINSLYEIAVNCLNLDVDKRPNMIEVAESLLMLKRSWSNTLKSHVPHDRRSRESYDVEEILEQYIDESCAN